MNLASFTSSFKIYIKAIIFISIGIAFFFLLGDLMVKDVNTTKRWYGVYDPTEEVEVVFFGNSHSFVSFNTPFLTSTGINSLAVGGSAERFPNTYYNVMEVLKYKNPKLIVIELNSLYYKLDFTQDKVMHYTSENLYGMKYGTNRFLQTLATIRPDSYINALFPQVKYHDNWKKLLEWKDIFVSNRQRKNTTRGFYRSDKIISDDDWNKEDLQRRKYIYSNENIEPSKIPEKNMELFKKLLAYCDDQGISVILVKAPVLWTSWKNISKASEEIATQFNIDVIDYNLLLEELAIEQSDFRDSGHVNSSGAKKITDYFLEEVLVGKYNMQPDFTDLMVLKDSSVVSHDNLYRYEVEFYNPNLVYSFSLYKDGEVISTKQYSKEAFYEFTLEEPGEYSVKYFAVKDSIQDPTKAEGANQSSGTFKNRVIIE